MRDNLISKKLPALTGASNTVYKGLDQLKILQIFMSLSSEGFIAFEPLKDKNEKIYDFRYVYANRQAEDLIGADLYLNTFLEKCPEAVELGLLQACIDVFLSKEPAEISNQYIFSEKLNRWFLAKARKSGDFLLIVFKDASAEYALKASEERYRFLSNSIPHIVWTATFDGRLDFYSQNWYELTGLNELQSLDNGWTRAIHPDDLARSEENWNYALLTGKPFKTTHRFITDTGGTRWMQTHGIPFQDEQGKVIKWFGTSTDIQEEMEALNNLKVAKAEIEEKNQKLERINKDLDTFLFSASHDLTGPLANLEGLTALLSSSLGNKLNEPEADYLGHIRQSTSKLKQTIFDLTRLIHFQQNFNAKKEKMNFNMVFKKVIQDLESLILTSGARIIFDFKVPEILYSAKNLFLIAYNLLNTSLRNHSPENIPEILVSSRYSGTDIELIVIDRGPGFKSEDMPGIFKLLQNRRVLDDSKDLSLFLVKRIIENNGGKIHINSMLNKGTEYCICF